MGIWFLTAWRRWSIRSMDMSNGEAVRGSSTRRPQWTLIGWPTAITFESLAPPINHILVTRHDGVPVPKVVTSLVNREEARRGLASPSDHQAVCPAPEKRTDQQGPFWRAGFQCLRASSRACLHGCI